MIREVAGLDIRKQGTQELWTAVDSYLADLQAPLDAALAEALEANAAASLPSIDITPLQGKLLWMLARIRGAKRILEIGTLGGYSTIWLARALPSDGRLVTLEVDPKHAEVARRNIARAGLSNLVELRVGPALETLPILKAESDEPFDFLFIDADKTKNPEYLKWAVKLSAPGSVIVVDNVIREGAIIEENNDDPNVQATRKFFEELAAEPRLSATTIQTVGSKGYDGFTIAIVVG